MKSSRSSEGDDVTVTEVHQTAAESLAERPLNMRRLAWSRRWTLGWISFTTTVGLGIQIYNQVKGN